MAEQANTTGRANLYRADGSRRPDAEVLEECGNIGLRLALLDDAMHRRANSTDSASRYPPRLFLSYKWGSDSENAWVAQLAQRLAERGWDVVTGIHQVGNRSGTGELGLRRDAVGAGGAFANAPGRNRTPGRAIR
jgi:hypothetical protein